MCAPLHTEIPRISMAFANPELAGSIHRRLLAMESQKQWNLVEMLASESTMHSQRLWSILQSPLRMENLIGYINTLSAQQKKLLLGRVALSLLRKICAFVEDDDNGHTKSHLVNNAPGNFHHGTIKISSWNENLEPESPKSHLGNGASELCHIDAALVLLIVAEAHEHEYEWSGLNISPRRYVCENILKMGYSVPGLMVDEVGLRSSIDLLCSYERLLGAFMSLSPPPPPPPPASAATILSLPSAIYTGGGVVCSICGDALKSRLSVASCLPCSHVYHRECIHSWLKARNTCPLCRDELPTDDVIYEVARHIRRIFC